MATQIFMLACGLGVGLMILCFLGMGCVGIMLGHVGDCIEHRDDEQ